MQEEEAIKVLEFQSRQRMWVLEQEAVRVAMQDKLRDEVNTRRGGRGACYQGGAGRGGGGAG